MSTTGSLIEFIGSLYPPLVVDADLADRMYPLGKKYSWLLEESGYMHLQASKPDTVGKFITELSSYYRSSVFKLSPTGYWKINPTGVLCWLAFTNVTPLFLFSLRHKCVRIT